MTTMSQKITIKTGTDKANYKLADDAIFFIKDTTTFTVGSDNVNALYYVVGGGGGGMKGTGTGANSVVGRGGSGGGVEAGMIDLIGSKEYTITVGAGGAGQTNSQVAVDGGLSSITCSTCTPIVLIKANGGYKGSNGENAIAGSSSGEGVKANALSKIDTASASSGVNLGDGGISPDIGSKAGKKGTAIDMSGTNSPSIGGGGGGGYGSTGNGGNGGRGSVILILTDNSNKIKNIEKQLREMNQLPGTMVDQYNQQYNATMMAGALWTVLATSLVFYVFTQV